MYYYYNATFIVRTSKVVRVTVLLMPLGTSKALQPPKWQLISIG